MTKKQQKKLVRKFLAILEEAHEETMACHREVMAELDHAIQAQEAFAAEIQALKTLMEERRK